MSGWSYHAVSRASSFMPVSTEVATWSREMQEAFYRWAAATPEQRAEWAREAEEQRRQERGQAERVELTLDALLDKLDFTREYAEHLVQPYCDCGDTADGWNRCQHARDLGL
jgi:hypothetical protein